MLPRFEDASNSKLLLGYIEYKLPPLILAVTDEITLTFMVLVTARPDLVATTFNEIS